MLEERYEIIKLLGKGRTGGVYEAEDTTLGRKVALRRFFAQTKNIDLADYKTEFENVAHSLSALQHPNLLRVYDAGVDQDGPYFISQLLHGETLHESIKNGPLPILEAQDLAQQMLDALSTAHSEGYIHGAITPGSILMTPRARGGYLYVILDMGLSKLAPIIQGKDSVLSVMADPAILAPEQFGGGIADERSDLYMLGNLVYMAIAGGHPFGGVDIKEAELLHKAGLPPIQTYNTNVPQEFCNWIAHLTQIDPANRPASAVEALKTLPQLVRPSKTQSVSINAAAAHLNLGPPIQLNTQPQPQPQQQTQAHQPLGNVTGPLTGVYPASAPNAHSKAAKIPAALPQKKSNNSIFLVLGLVGALAIIAVVILQSGGNNKSDKTKNTAAIEADSSSAGTSSKDSGMSYSERNATKEEKIIITDFDGTKPITVNKGWFAGLNSKLDGNTGAWLVKSGIKFPLNAHAEDIYDLGWKVTYLVRPIKGSHKFGFEMDQTLNPGWTGSSVSLNLMLSLTTNGQVELSARDSTHQIKAGKSITIPYCGDKGWHTIVIEQKPLDENGNYTVTLDGKPAFKDILTTESDFAAWKNHLFSFTGANSESEWAIKQFKLETL